MSAFIQAFLNALICCKANQTFMLALAQRHIPIRVFEIARKQYLIECPSSEHLALMVA